MSGPVVSSGCSSTISSRFAVGWIPNLALRRWFAAEVLGTPFHRAAAEGRPACPFFDEVTELRERGTELKALVDSGTVRVVVTGSSALRSASGPRSPRRPTEFPEDGVVVLAGDRGDPATGGDRSGLPFYGPGETKPRSFWENLRKQG